MGLSAIFSSDQFWVLKPIPEMICRNTHVHEICNCLRTSWHILKSKPNMKTSHLQLLHTFTILGKYWTNRSQSRYKNGRFYMNHRSPCWRRSVYERTVQCNILFVDQRSLCSVIHSWTPLVYPWMAIIIRTIHVTVLFFSKTMCKNQYLHDKSNNDPFLNFTSSRVSWFWYASFSLNVPRYMP